MIREGNILLLLSSTTLSVIFVTALCFDASVTVPNHFIVLYIACMQRGGTREKIPSSWSQ